MRQLTLVFITLCLPLQAPAFEGDAYHWLKTEMAGFRAAWQADPNSAPLTDNYIEFGLEHEGQSISMGFAIRYCSGKIRLWEGHVVCDTADTIGEHRWWLPYFHNLYAAIDVSIEDIEIDGRNGLATVVKYKPAWKLYEAVDRGESPPWKAMRGCFPFF